MLVEDVEEVVNTQQVEIVTNRDVNLPTPAWELSRGANVGPFRSLEWLLEPLKSNIPEFIGHPGAEIPDHRVSIDALDSLVAKRVITQVHSLHESERK